MSKYTTEVRYICETSAGLKESVGEYNVDEVIRSSLFKIFDFEFPIFDESYRSVLETKILKHYYTREIGFETVGLWKMKLNTKLNEIMPYYNKLYESELLKFNPFYDVDLTTTHNKKNDGTTGFDGTTKEGVDFKGVAEDVTDVHATGNSHTDYLEKYSDTPQGAVSDLLTMKYLTNATDTDTDTEFENDTKTTDKVTTNNETDRNVETESLTKMLNLEDYIEHVTGKRGGHTYMQMLKEFRETFLNIDLMILKDISDLFLNLW